MSDKKFRHLNIFYDYGKAEPKDIEAFEREYGICFPQTYKELMLKHNRAKFEESDFDFINSRGEEDGREFMFYSFGEDKKDNGENIVFYNRGLQNPIYYGVPGLIGIGSTAEGDTICFDYRDDPKGCNPKVVVLVHDEYEDLPDGSSHMKVEKVADSFDEFLDLFYRWEDKYGEDEE